MDFDIRKIRAAQGRRKLHAERAEYFRLVNAGYSNKEASALVGVNERTGREWRNGRWDPQRFRPPAAQTTPRPEQGVYTKRAPVPRERVKPTGRSACSLYPGDMAGGRDGTGHRRAGRSSRCREARRVVDAMRHRSRIGETLALSALGRYLRHNGRGGVRELQHIARELGALSVVRPAVEAVLA